MRGVEEARALPLVEGLEITARLQQVRSELPVEIVRILRRLMAKNPAHRYQQPADLIVDLVRFSGQMGLAMTGNPLEAFLATRPAAAWRRHLPWAVPLVLLVAFVVALDVVWPPGDAARWRSVRHSPGEPAAEGVRNVGGGELQANPASENAGQTGRSGRPNGNLAELPDATASDNIDAGTEPSESVWPEQWTWGNWPLPTVEEGTYKAASARSMSCCRLRAAAARSPW